MPHEQVQVTLRKRPRYYRDGEAGAYLPMSAVERSDEMAIGLMFMMHRKLFGLCYMHLTRDYFWEMPPGSGVFVTAFTPSQELVENMSFPGDVDLLIVPYEGDKLIASRTLAVELKVVRASFENQAKSPTRYGFSQAQGLLDHGFPYAAVVHIVVAGRSPESAWREVQVAEFINPGVSDEIRFIGTTRADLLAHDLVERGYGRLKANRPSDTIGVASAYYEDGTRCEPMGSPALPNPNASRGVMDSVCTYLHRYPERFFDIPRYDP